MMVLEHVPRRISKRWPFFNLLFHASLWLLRLGPILAFSLYLVDPKQNNLGARATEIQCPYLNENIY